MRHIALLGDSIFDNAAYTAGAPDVVTHLRRVLPASWRATLCAVDGATTRSVVAQLERVPADVSHIVLSVGGNDALQHSDLLEVRTTSALKFFDEFARRVAGFEASYRSALDQVVALGRTTIACTVYNGALEPARATAARLGLALFNDVILRTAVDRGVDVIELRSVCTEASDYANPIEPSGSGGLKIAGAIAKATAAVASSAPPSRVWVSP